MWVALDTPGKKLDAARASTTPMREERHSEPGPTKTSTIALDGRSSEPYPGKGSLTSRHHEPTAEGFKPVSGKGAPHGGSRHSEQCHSSSSTLLTSRHSESSQSNLLDGRLSDPQVGKGSSLFLAANENRYSDQPQTGKGQGNAALSLGAKLSEQSSGSKSVPMERVPRQVSSSTSAGPTGVRSEQLPGRVSGAGLQRPHQAEPKRQQFQNSDSANRTLTRIRLD
jgi:hypothetical protein